VTSVAIDAATVPNANAMNTSVSDLTRGKGKLAERISWTQNDKALPLPFSPREVDPVLALVIDNSDLVAKLDREMLQVSALSPGAYDLLIDQREIGTFTAGQLAAGINLALLDTPMLAQSRLVAFDTKQVNDLEAARFEIIHGSPAAEQLRTAQALAVAYAKGVERQHAEAQPFPHHYDLVLANLAASSRH
jgi:hypothetical protein